MDKEKTRKVAKARMKELFLVLLAAFAIGGCRTADTGGQDFREVIQRAKDRVFPTLVYIRVVREALDEGKDSKQVVSGSGVVISPDG